MPEFSGYPNLNRSLDEEDDLEDRYRDQLAEASRKEQSSFLCSCPIKFSKTMLPNLNFSEREALTF